MRTACLTILLIFSILGSARATEIGIILKDIPGCTVITTDGSSRCRQNGLLYSGDIIAANKAPALLDIQWIARDVVRFEPLANGQYRLQAAPTTRKKGLLAIAGDLLGFARKAGRVTHGAVTRGSEELLPSLPGDGATLLPGERVTFSWCSGMATHLIVKDAQDRQTVALAVPQGATSLTVKVDALGLKPGGAYRWELSSGGAKGGSIRLLDQGAAGMIVDAFAQLDAAKENAGIIGLKKAALLHYLTSSYSKDFSMGWLQYRILQQLPEPLSPDDAAAANRLTAESAVKTCN